MNSSIIDTIKQAAQERRVLKIIYTGKDGTSEGWRYIEPYSLSHDKGDKALFAWDRGKDGIRRFIIDRIADIEITNETFSPKYSIEVN